MLLGFKICFPDLKLQSSILLFICVCHHRICLYFYAQIGAIRGLHPSRLYRVLVRAKQLQREGSLWLHRAPGDWRDADPLLGLQVLRCFRASSGPLEGIVALHESTFESQGDIAPKKYRLGVPDQAEDRDFIPLL